MAEMRLLIVEDNQEDAQLVTRMLEKSGLIQEWQCVENEGSFIEALRCNPTIIISDNAMPSFSAHRALSILKEFGMDVPFIVISGTMGEESAVKIMQAGADDYLLKGDLRRLPSAVKRAVNNARIRKERHQTELALREYETRLNLALRSASVGTWNWKRAERKLLCDDQLYALFHLTPDNFNGTYKGLMRLVCPEDRNGLIRAIRQASYNKNGFNYEFKLSLSTGEERLIGMRGGFYFTESSEVEGVAGVCWDITGGHLPITGDAEDLLREGNRIHKNSHLNLTDSYSLWSLLFMNPTIDFIEEFRGGLGGVADIAERKTKELVLLDNESRLRILIDANPESVMLLDEGGVIRHINKAGREILEADDDDQLLGEKIYPMIMPEYIESFTNFYGRVLSGQRDFFTFEIVSLNGTRRWLESHAAVLNNQSDNKLYVLIISRNITERKRSEEYILHLAHHDSLTNLPNRMLLHDRLQRAIFDANRRGRLVGVVFIDLDKFKSVNDTLGHQAGDLLLKAIAERLTNLVRKNDTVGRLGGDEFVIILADMSEEAAVYAVTEKVVKSLVPPFDICGRQLNVTASLGVALYPGDGGSVQELLRNADVAMYRAKELGRNLTQIYSSDTAMRPGMNMIMECDLRRALDNNEFTIHYQPIVDLHCRRLVGLEALIRWNHSERGLILPDEFILAAEDTSLINSIGQWMLKNVCLQNRLWQQQGCPAVRISVNLSTQQALDPDLVNNIKSVLAETGLETHYLELEVAETTLLENLNQIGDNLQKLRELGVRLSVDDFGTGNSSLKYLKRFPVHSLKMDRSFINGIVDQDNFILARAIINLAHNLNFSVVAEGVESWEQLDFLLKHQCETVQGYLFSPPVPAQAVPALLGHNFTI